ncbi:MAG: DUF6893 family small protein [Nocardioidaceae bacterium]
MRTLGRATTLVLLVGVVAGVLVGIKSLPDIRRYLDMRNM